MNSFSTVKDNKDLYNDRRNLFARYTGFTRSKTHEKNEDALYNYIPTGSKVLDYGCDKGSLGFLGVDPVKNIVVDGYDPYVDDDAIRFHDRAKIGGGYDYIVFSHVLEHEDIDIDEILSWARSRTGHIIISHINTKNLFNTFFDEYSHNKPTDNISFINYVEHRGYEMQHIVRNDLRLETWKHYNRVLFNVLMGFDPYYNVMYDFKTVEG